MPAEDEMIFRLWVDDVRLPLGDAGEIRGRAVEKNLAARRLDVLIGKAMSADTPAWRVVDVDGEMSRKDLRGELLLILQAIEADHPLTEAQAELRGALLEPAAGL
jgi:hypothetical protein